MLTKLHKTVTPPKRANSLLACDLVHKRLPSGSSTHSYHPHLFLSCSISRLSKSWSYRRKPFLMCKRKFSPCSAPCRLLALCLACLRRLLLKVWRSLCALRLNYSRVEIQGTGEHIQRHFRIIISKHLLKIGFLIFSYNLIPLFEATLNFVCSCELYLLVIEIGLTALDLSHHRPWILSVSLALRSMF